MLMQSRVAGCFLPGFCPPRPKPGSTEIAKRAAVSVNCVHLGRGGEDWVSTSYSNRLGISPSAKKTHLSSATTRSVAMEVGSNGRGSGVRDGIVVVDHGSRRAESNAMLHEFVRMFKEETGAGIVEAAHMELADPTIAHAFDRCVAQGARRVVVSPYFLFPGRHWDRDIPALVAEAARKHPRVPYLVTAPIGLHKSMVAVVQDRMDQCLRRAAGEASECEMCEGTGRCKLLVAQDLQPSC